MAQRTTVDEIKKIMPDIDPLIEDLQPFIDAAVTLVDELIVPTNKLTTDQLTDVETWLAGHFISIPDPQTIREAAGSIGGTYQIPRAGQGLEGTSYGQQAMLLDLSGELARWSKSLSDGTSGLSATGFWLGTE